MSRHSRDGRDNPDGLPIAVLPEGTEGPAEERSRSQRGVVKTRQAIMAALNLPDFPGLPSLDLLTSAVLGQRAQDRAFWLTYYLLLGYFLGHQLFGLIPCSSSAQLDALREFALEVQAEVEQPLEERRQP